MEQELAQHWGCVSIHVGSIRPGCHLSTTIYAATGDNQLIWGKLLKRMPS